MNKGKAIFCFLLLTAWILSGWPQLLEKPSLPPEIPQVYALNDIIRPDGDSSPLQWTSTGGNHYGELTTDPGDLVTQPTTPNTSTNINNGGSSGNADQFAMGTLTVTQVTAITVWVYGSSTKNSSTLTVNLYWDGSAQQYSSVSLNTGASWQSTSFTGLTLTQSQLNSLEVYIKGAAGGRTYTAHALYADVTYTYSTVSISLSGTDGSVAFLTRALNSTVDTTGSGINDPETVQVDTGPADLDVKSTVFTEGGNTWALDSSNDSDQVQWEYSKDGSAWSTFLVAGSLYTLDTNVPQSNTRNLYLRLTLPTFTTSYNQYGSTVTIVASAP